MDGLGSFGFSFLGILSLIIGFTKEILIIILAFKLIKVSNIFIKKNKVDSSENMKVNIEKDNN